MRLIDADAWIEELNQIISDEENPKGAKEWAVGMIAAITVRSTAYDVDKVVEQLRELNDNEFTYGKVMGIIKAGGVNEQDATNII